MSKDYHYRGPSIDHSLLSPNGHISKRARAAAMKKEADKLFPAGYWDKPEESEAEKATRKAETLRLTAKTLRGLAERGMNRHRYTYEALKLEEQATAILEATL